MMGMITAKHTWSDHDTTKYKLCFFKAERRYGKFIGENQSFNRTHTLSK